MARAKRYNEQVIDLVTAMANADRYGVVTKSDSTVLDFDGLYVGDTSGAGTLQISPDGGTTTVPFANAANGYHPIKGNRVMNATTTTDIVWLKWS